jgi:fatty acid desaturase
MKKNVGAADRIIRLILAIALIALAYFGVLTAVWSITVAWILAAVFVFTAIAGTCPLYSLFGISSCRVKKPAQ